MKMKKSDGDPPPDSHRKQSQRLTISPVALFAALKTLPYVPSPRVFRTLYRSILNFHFFIIFNEKCMSENEDSFVIIEQRSAHSP
jgi:hypothetical protein